MKVFRRRIALFFMAMLMFFITGCKEVEKQEYIPDPNDAYTLAAKTSAGSVHEVEKGVYRIENIDSNYYIKYADKSDMENWVYLCNKPNCEHDDFDCNAYIDTSFPIIWIYEGKIYFNEVDKLYTMSMDGSNHEKVRDLPGVEMASKGGGVATTNFNMDGMFIYSTFPVLEVGTEAINERTLRVYDISLKDEKQDKIFFEKAIYTNNYFIEPSAYSQGKDILVKLEQKGSSFNEVFYEYNSKNNSFIELKTDDIYSNKSYFEDNLGYYYDNGFIKRNMDSGEISKITEAAIENGDGLITDKYFLEFNKSGLREEEKKLFIYDREGKLLNEINFDKDSEIARMGLTMYWTSDRLFFSVLNADLSEDNFYIFYDDIGKADAKLHYSYTNSWKGIWRLEDFE